MTQGNPPKGTKHESVWAVLYNLVAAVLLTVTFFYQTAMERTVCSILVLAAWIVLILLIRHGTNLNWDRIIDVGCKFLLTWPIFWVIREHRRRLRAEREEARLRDLLSAWPDPSTIQGLVDPEQQEKSLKVILDEMGSMTDTRLSIIVERIQHFLEDTLRAVRHNGNYGLFRHLIETLSTYGPEDHPETYTAFLGLLEEILSMNSPDGYAMKLKQDIADPITSALRQATPTQYTRVNDLVHHVMDQGEEGNELARRVIDLLPELDWQAQDHICLLLFDAAKNRAFRYPLCQNT